MTSRGKPLGLRSRARIRGLSGGLSGGGLFALLASASISATDNPSLNCEHLKTDATQFLQCLAETPNEPGEGGVVSGSFVENEEPCYCDVRKQQQMKTIQARQGSSEEGEATDE